MKLFNANKIKISLEGVVDAKVEIRKKEYTLIDQEKSEEELPMVEELKKIESEMGVAQNKYFDVKLAPYYELK